MSGFPYGYKTLSIGKRLGMPVPGTMTSVWWETLQDRSLYHPDHTGCKGLTLADTQSLRLTF